MLRTQGDSYNTRRQNKRQALRSLEIPQGSTDIASRQTGWRICRIESSVETHTNEASLSPRGEPSLFHKAPTVMMASASSVEPPVTRASSPMLSLEAARTSVEKTAGRLRSVDEKFLTIAFRNCGDSSSSSSVIRTTAVVAETNKQTNVNGEGGTDGRREGGGVFLE